MILNTLEIELNQQHHQLQHAHLLQPREVRIQESRN